jgi:hypothetical protein
MEVYDDTLPQPPTPVDHLAADAYAARAIARRGGNDHDYRKDGRFVHTCRDCQVGYRSMFPTAGDRRCKGCRRNHRLNNQAP